MSFSEPDPPRWTADEQEAAAASSASDSSFTDADLQKWQSLYDQNKKNSPNRDEEQDASSSAAATSPVRVVTFDLDNTLWNTSAVISAANDALADYLETQRALKVSKRVELVMKDLFQANPEAYGPSIATFSSNATGKTESGPVFLTRLRQDAIRQVVLPQASSPQDADQLAQDAFAVWAQARHDAIEQHLADGVVETLTRLKQKRLIVGAITDGNSDPRRVPCLAPHFDFVVNAEWVGVGKPHGKIYSTAIRHVLLKVLAGRSEEPVEVVNSSDEKDDLYDTVGPWWVHVGDDFTKDVVAAKDFQMRTIWCREWILEELQAKQAQFQPPSSSSASVQEFVAKMSALQEKDSIPMQIGAADFLLQSIQEEFADATIDNFVQVGTTIAQWQQEAASGGVDENVGGATSVAPPLPEPPVAAAVEPMTTFLTEEQEKQDNVAILDLNQVVSPKTTTTTTTPAKKFCVYCGTSLPFDAKFCSSCGKPQPVLTATDN